MEINLNANTREDGKYFVFLKAVPLKGQELTLKTREKYVQQINAMTAYSLKCHNVQWTH